MSSRESGDDYQPEAIPYAAESRAWLVDEEGVVSRNDVVYTSPSPQPWEAMPVGGGDLSAMVRWDGDLHLHLTKSDCWGYQKPADAQQGTRYLNNVSPGHVRLGFGERAAQAARLRFRQRLDPYRGRVLVEIGEGDEAAQLQVWGHPKLRVLVLEASDPAGVLGPCTVTLEEWRETMWVSCTETRLQASEVQTRPARPHLAGAGMEDYYPERADPLEGRGAAVAVSSPDVRPARCEAEALSATMTPTASPAGEYRVLIAAAVTGSGDPLVAASAELERAEAMSADDLRQQQRQWWEQYWGRSFVRVTSPDRSARWLNAAYYVHLYTLGCTNRGPVPAKWDGGAGLMRGDERNWGICEWVQEVRFTFMPLYAANRLEMARGLCDFYSGMADYLRAQTQRMWGLPGLWIPETVTPWGHVEDLVLAASPPEGVNEGFGQWDPETAPYGLFHHYNKFVGFLFTAGLEVCQHYLTCARYSGDEAFLREQAYPAIRDVCRFVTGLLREGDDGRYHLDPANALETWQMVRDPADTIEGLRAVLPECIELAAEHPEDAEVRDHFREILANLPDPALGWWREDNVIEPDVEVYAPAAEGTQPAQRSNAENPQLYRVYPFGLSGIDSADHELARRTFEKRICVLNHGWAMDAIWAARLGLGEKACELLAEHARIYNRFRYGGWDSNDSNVFPDRLAVAPFLDAGGGSAFALQEILLQSQGGVIRIGPAVSGTWSGTFGLRAEGGFVVTADIASGDVRVAEIESLLGGECVVANPWPDEMVVTGDGVEIARSADRRLAFPTRGGARYLLERATHRAALYRAEALRDTRDETPGLPGRDA